jgi:peptidoglycan/LPS O-acetylase OafA/YrhL
VTADPDAPGRLVHEPALDGQRGLAIAAVVAFHLGHLGGGFLGVDLFFVLSGYLITSLLVLEHRRRERIDLPHFWSRRVRRLLPALFVLLIGVAVLLVLLATEGERARARADALTTLGYLNNWYRAFSDLGYWDMFGNPSPLDHMWSLAIEEQFYVLWPLVVTLVLARRRIATLAWVAVSRNGACGR